MKKQFYIILIITIILKQIVLCIYDTSNDLKENNNYHKRNLKNFTNKEHIYNNQGEKFIFSKNENKTINSSKSKTNNNLKSSKDNSKSDALVKVSIFFVVIIGLVFVTLVNIFARKVLSHFNIIDSEDLILVNKITT